MFSINLVFVDAETIRSLNRKYRDLDKATTVLSFYYGAPLRSAMQNFGRGKGRAAKQVNFPKIKDTVNCLGEIFICQSLAAKQGLKVEELIIHGYKSLLSQIPTTNNLRA